MKYSKHPLAVGLLGSIVFAFATSGFAADTSTLNTLTEAEKKAGWTLLFDGKTTKGWRNFKQDKVSDGWKVVDGTISRVGKAGDIMTVEQYAAFDLSLEYKISKGGNSGLMFHVTEEESTPWRTGPEIQIQDNVDGHDPQKAGWLYQLYKADVDATKPAGQWNTLQIRITPEQCVTYMNGVRYARYVKGSKDWDERVAKSKFGKMPKFGKATVGHICLQDHGNPVSFRNIKIRKVTATGGQAAVDGALPVEAKVAFPKLEWADWSPVSDAGKPQPLRPIVLTHAGDGSNRVFVATQQGVIHVFDNDQAATSTKVFLDISSKVVYDDRQNEEGLLGMAFHPNYKQTGQFFIYYTTRDTPQMSVISRFRVSKDDPDEADAKFEEEVMRIKQPFWNHNGGTIAFGPDGYLYVGLGDGGKADDPFGNAQNLETLLGSILRIDINHKDKGKNYAIPSDNPFVKSPKNARGEIWAYGLRNVWRMSFDRNDGTLWAGDVGQNLWEEINIITRGGNYGWNRREATHSFGPQGSGPRKDLIEPIWEYDHNVGKSITGGYVYRGSRLPQLAGMFLYADYITGKLWALRYDTSTKKVQANYSIASSKLPVISFGEDEKGEVYFMIVASNGRGIYRFEPTADK